MTINVEAVAAELEAEALAAPFARNHRVITFTTAQGNAAMALVTVTVTDPGIVENPDSATTSANTTVNIPVLANDIDNLTGNNVNLIVATVTQPPAGQGSVAIAGNQKSVNFTPAAAFVGSVQFTYTAGRA